MSIINALDLSMEAFNQARKEKLGDKKFFIWENKNKSDAVIVIVSNSPTNALDEFKAAFAVADIPIVPELSEITEVELTKRIVCVRDRWLAV